eukprot:1308968-Amorphochlora_amoeboformis.AAC.1
MMCSLNERQKYLEVQKKAVSTGAPPQNSGISDLANVVKDWDVDKVCNILTAMNLGNYVATFKKNNICGKKFLVLTTQTL